VARFDRAIPPGGEGRITLEVKTAKYQGKILKSAKVFSNDPKQPRVTIGLTGNVWAPVRINPQYAWLNGIVGDTVENVVRLRGQKKASLIVRLASVSIPDKVDVELKEVEKGRGYELKIRNKVQGEAKYAGEVKLTTNYSERREIRIKVSGNIRPPIEAKPKTVSFGRMSLEHVQMWRKNGIMIRRPVTVILNKGSDLRINKAELERALFRVVSIRPLQPGRTVQLQIEADSGKLKKGLNVDHLRIYTNQTDGQILEVPIHFELL
jgi:hypothetical protein